MFVNTHLFSPVVIDNFRYPDVDSIEFESYWTEQRRRCIEGYTVGGVHITGKHYWYLNFWPIYGNNYKTGRKGIIRPRFTDLDYEKFAILERMYKEEKDNLFLKARQKGYSEWVAAICAYELNFYAGSQVIIVAGQEIYSEKTFLNLKRGLNDQIDTEFYKERWPDNHNFFRFAYQDVEKDSEGRKKKPVKGLLSEAYCLTALTNTQVCSRLSPTLIVYEEVGNWKKNYLIKTKDFVEPSLMAERKKTGYSIFIGTGGDMDDSIPDVMEMFYNPEAHNLLVFPNEYEEDPNYREKKVACFIPGWKYEVIDKDGNSLREESIKALKDDREKKKGVKRIEAITQKPFSPSEAFMISTEGFFGEEVITNLNQRRAFILTHREETKGQKGILKWRNSSNKSAGVIWEAKEDGWLTVFEHPQTKKVEKNGKMVEVVYDNLYKSATDSYDKNEAAYSNSQGSCHVIKGFLDAEHTYNCFVAKVIERPTVEEGGADLFYEHTAMLTMYYNAINLIEYSNLRIFDWYGTHGLSYLLKERPRFVISSWINKPTTSQRYGIDPNTKIYWLNSLRNFLTYDNIQNMNDLEQIEALARFKYDPSGKRYNCDITISTSLAVICLEDEKEMVVEAEIGDMIIFPSFRTSEDGSMVQSYNEYNSIMNG